VISGASRGDDSECLSSLCRRPRSTRPRPEWTWKPSSSLISRSSGGCCDASACPRATRQQRTLSLDAEAPLDLPCPSLSAEDLLDRAKARTVLDAVLAEMPVTLRSVFVLFELEQLSTVEIAELLGVPRGTVASRLRRAREDFEKRVRRLEASTRSPGGTR
jgi:RNA polymerase sigma factor (sigma-70 family)